MQSLKSSNQHRAQVVKLLMECFVTQNNFGKDPKSFEKICEYFQIRFEDCEASLVVDVLDTWVLTEKNFPTIAEIMELVMDHPDRDVSHLSPQRQLERKFRIAGIK